MRKKWKVLCAAVFLIFILAAWMMSAFAQEEENLFEDDTAFFKMEEKLVVSASKREQKLSEAPVTISVVTHDDIVRGGYRTIPDALRMVPGIYVQRNTWGDIQVAIRGLVNGPPESGPLLGIARNVLVLLNGRSFFNDVYGGMIWSYLPITVEDIERIEIVRGPSSALFGANAVNGVINIITKDPEKDAGFIAAATAAMADENNELLNLRVSDKYKDFAWRLTTERNINDYQEYSEYDVTKQQWVAGRGDRGDPNFPSSAGMPDYNFSRVNLVMVYRFNEKNSVDIQAGRSNGSGNMMGYSGDFLKPNHHLDNLILKGSYNTHIGAAPSKLTISWLRGRIGTDEQGYNIPPNFGEQDGLSFKSFDFEGQSTITLSSNDIMVAGVNWRKVYTKSGNVWFIDLNDISDPEPNQEFLSFFLNNEHKFSDRWKLVLGARYDDFDHPDDSAVSPQAILMYTPTAIATYRLSYSEAIRTPFLSDLFLSADVEPFGDLERPLNAAIGVDTIGPVIRFFGNPNLEFPRITNYELGSSWKISRRHTLDLNLFTYTYRDSIVFDNNMFTTGGGDPFSPFHIGNTESGFTLTFKNDPNDIQSYGAELGSTVQFSDRMKGWANVTYQKGKYGGTRSKTTPEFIANAGVSANVRGWKIDLSANYATETQVPTTNVLDRNMDQLTAPSNLCPGDLAGPCFLDPDPVKNAAIQSAAAITFWCDLHDYNTAFVGGAIPYAAVCPTIDNRTNNNGWWTMLTTGTALQGVPMSAVLTNYPTNPAAFAAQLGNFYGTYLQGLQVPVNAQLDTVLSGFAQAMLANERIQATSITYSNLTTDSYFLVNLRLAKEIIKNEAEFYISGENLLNEKHREFSYGEILGRKIIGGINWNF